MGVSGIAVEQYKLHDKLNFIWYSMLACCSSNNTSCNCFYFVEVQKIEDYQWCIEKALICSKIEHFYLKYACKYDEIGTGVAV